MPTGCKPSTRTRIRAFRIDQELLIVAEGELPTPGYRVDLQQDPRRIFPPQFDLLRCQLPGIFPQHVVPFRYSELFSYPADQGTVTVHHADGADEVEVEECGKELSVLAEVLRGGAEGGSLTGADEAVGFSKNLSFDEAFARALANLPPLDDTGTADVLTRIQVIDTGALFGGIAGFHDLFVRVSRTHD